MAIQPRNTEIVVGIVARIGIETPHVAQAIAKCLSEYGYNSIHQIKITDTLKQLSSFSGIPSKPMEERYKAFIGACNEVRLRTSSDNIMARLAVARIAALRAADAGCEEGELEKLEAAAVSRRAFVLNQLKRPEESALLRSLYGEHYVQISCHAPVESRAQALSVRISHDHPAKPRADAWIGEAHNLIRVDDAEEDNPHGQRVRDIFPSSDVVIDASSQAIMDQQLSRFFSVLFGDYSVTPTADEHGMQLASTAALRSSDLSRQVGAAILNANNEVEALGCNEVPKAFGGTYWEGDSPDGREHALGGDTNDRRKREVLTDLAFRFRTAGLLSEKYRTDDDALLKDIFSRNDDVISDSQVMDSLEYGRTIHAEMNAITDAARNGHSIRGSTLYCNTFPCHNCAKHIVASGIRKLFYLKPYPKSYASDLFVDSVVIDQNSSDKVLFNQFIGITGPMYIRVFQKNKWKMPDGSIREFNRKTASFVHGSLVPSYVRAESLLSKQLGGDLRAAELVPMDPAN
ncbi:anti-phage dCTP deaminase [Phenylobacterium sp.]|uniref:anti-phage dCTP deaminase n=1 Tax=Phenylobacterium sp. TaxID=1871053 RepID=UPI00273696E7|nr:anti-phage dCTP deaminase [Phenylobacterium sp.]MDP3855629.1 anti-phage dCTP deaminase [Phenylobacterium sp.]